MKQVLGIRALVALGITAALLFVVQPAQAQTVAANGFGDNLIFSYWTTERNVETLLAISSPFGERTRTEPRNVVGVNVSGTTFRICLEGADSWTAVIKKATPDDPHSWVVVVDPGECDADLVAPGSSMEETPMPNVPLQISDTHMGYIHAYTDPDGTLLDSSDDDRITEDAVPRRLIGTAYLLSPSAGFSSAYAATALLAASEPVSATVGCGTGPAFTPHETDTEFTGSYGMCSAAQITAALIAQDKEMLLGRWTALADENVYTQTDIVLTFPGMNNLLYPPNAVGATGEPVEAAADPVSLMLFDDMGESVGDFEITLDQTVNKCSIGMAMHMMDMDEDMMMDMDEDMMMEPMLMCNGAEVDGDISGSGGTFRIFNGVLATVDQDNASEVDDPGTEDTSALPTEALDVDGLVLSFFMGTDGKLYDQAASLQWAGDTVADTELIKGDVASDDL